MDLKAVFRHAEVTVSAEAYFHALWTEWARRCNVFITAYDFEEREDEAVEVLVGELLKAAGVSDGCLCLCEAKDNFEAGYEQIERVWVNRSQTAIHADITIGPGKATHHSRTVNLITTSKDVFDAFRAETKRIGTETKSKRQKRNIKTLITIPHEGLTTKVVDYEAPVLIRENYAPIILAQFDNVVAMKARRPGLTIIEGPSGTGKTHLVLGLMAEVKSTNFLVIPAHMVEKLGDPEFIGLLSDRDKKGRGLCVVVEDADDSLVRRGSDNMSAISCLLNVSDGILGRLLELHIIVTTNAARLDFDPAIVRGGRVFEHMHVGALEWTQSHDIFIRLTDAKIARDDVKCLRSANTLAEIYEAAEKAKKK